MCDPISGTMAALSIAGAAAGYAGQVQQAKAVAKYQSKQFSGVADSAVQNYYQQLSQAGLSQQQERAASSEQDMQNNLQSEEAAASVRARDNGLTGNSVLELMQHFAAVRSQNTSNLLTNLDWRNQQLYQQELSARSEVVNRINGAQPGPVNLPSPIGPALEIGTSALGYTVQSMAYNRQGPFNPNNYGNGNDPGWMYRSFLK
jgi:hypothetical protein